MSFDSFKGIGWIEALKFERWVGIVRVRINHDIIIGLMRVENLKEFLKERNEVIKVF